MDDEAWTDEVEVVAGPVPAEVWIAAVTVPTLLVTSAIWFGAAVAFPAAAAVMAVAALVLMSKPSR